MEKTELIETIHKFKKLNILVIGDVMLDRFIWGNVDRISPEAPIPIVKVDNENAYPGGAANVARNLCKFINHTEVLSILGNDDRGNELLDLMKKENIDTNLCLKFDQRNTTVKTRIIAHSQHMLRIDREKIVPLNDIEMEEFFANLKTINKNIDAVIFEDYGKGLLTQELFDKVVKYIRQLEKKYQKKIFICVDPNPSNPLNWNNVDLVKPNRKEAYAAAEIYSDNKFGKINEKEKLEQIGKKLFKKWQCNKILITLGENGMCLLERNNKTFFVEAKAREVYDVSGAGDTSIAFLTMALALGLNPQKATEIANIAASIVVGKVGTATLNIDDFKKI